MSSPLFEVVALDDHNSVRTHATSYAEAADSVRASAETARNNWQSISYQYNAAESFMVNIAMDRPAELASQLDDVAEGAKAALSTYADRLAELAEDRKTLLEDIDAFNASGPGLDELEAREEAILGLRDRCHILAQEKDAAQNRCVQALRGLSTTIAAAPESTRPKREPTADEADDIHDPTPGAAVEIARHAGFVPGDSFENGLDTLPWAAQQYGNVLGAGSNYFVHNLAEDLLEKSSLRADWVPKGLAQLAATNRRVGQFTAKFLDWTPNHKGPSDVLLDIDDARHPFHKPTGVADGAKKFVQRGLTFLNPENLVPKEGLDATRDLWRNVGKWAGRAGGVVGAGFTAVASWQEDSQKHPEMSGGEKAFRAGTKTAGSVGGGFAGAKAGAVLGATIGTFLGPGPGTAVGAVIGGVIGGISGSLLGTKAAEEVNSIAREAMN